MFFQGYEFFCSVKCFVFLISVHVINIVKQNQLMHNIFMHKILCISWFCFTISILCFIVSQSGLQVFCCVKYVTLKYHANVMFVIFNRP
jgi:hypothetical protein